MKKSAKISLTVLITVAIYVGLYFLLVGNSAPQNYAQSMGIFTVSAIAAIIAVPIGMLVTWILKKNKVDEKKSNIINLVVAVIYGYLLGWASLLGMIIGQFIMEKEK